MDRLTVLGGGSPFTVALIDALAAELSGRPFELVLYGRDPERLDLVKRYAAARLDPLGWRVAASSDLHRALAGSRYIIHQIRYGGLEGRAEDEQLAVRCGVVADETLGLGALNSALRMVAELRTVAAAIATSAPDAWVLNLTNPLSVATSILTEAGVKRCVGVCELPSTTAQLVADVVDVPLQRLEWQYWGLNHRGFLFGFRYDGTDQLPRLLTRLGKGTLNGIPPFVMADLGAVPTKYFGLLLRGRRGAPRAEFLRTLGDRVMGELRAAPGTSPPSLALRRLDWYRNGVVPLLAALAAGRPGRQIVNLWGGDGLTRESPAAVSAHGIIPETPPDLPPRARAYLMRFELHERRVLEAVARPSLATITAALAADPTLEAPEASTLAELLCSRHGGLLAERGQPVGT